MKGRVYNFSAGPAMLPEPVMRQIKEEFLNYRGLGASVIEISHRAKEFLEIVEETSALFRELTALPENYRILYLHGGARMQFSSIPLNLMARQPARKALYFETGYFARMAAEDARQFGAVEIVAGSGDTGFDRIPDFNPALLDKGASYAYLTSNNTIFGTRWEVFPDTGSIPLVADMTSEILSRVMDYSRFGLVFAGLQKNLGPSGLAILILREDLLGYAAPGTPPLLNYARLHEKNSLLNTTNTFALYVACLVLKWIRKQGGVASLEAKNEGKAELLYRYLDQTAFYTSFAHPAHRSIMNITFTPQNPALLDPFLEEAVNEGFVALRGHRVRGGVRASIYNAMPLAGVQALLSFMADFERRKG